MLGPWRSIEAQQRALLKRVDHPTIRTYLETPLPTRKTPLEDVEFLSVDFETTGLDSKKEAILSIGYTHLRGGRIMLKESGHRVIRINTPLCEKSVAIHQITHERMEAGIALHDALEELMQILPGKVMLVHCAPIEKGFLAAAIKRVYNCKLPFLWVDTLEIERKRLDRGVTPVQANRLRLANLRSDYHLPRYGGHNALEDAIATAELFMVLMAQRENKQVLLRDILC